jgi:hypothetical protein
MSARGLTCVARCSAHPIPSAFVVCSRGALVAFCRASAAGSPISVSVAWVRCGLAGTVDEEGLDRDVRLEVDLA